MEEANKDRQPTEEEMAHRWWSSLHPADRREFTSDTGDIHPIRILLFYRRRTKKENLLSTTESTR